MSDGARGVVGSMDEPSPFFLPIWGGGAGEDLVSFGFSLKSYNPSWVLLVEGKGKWEELWTYKWRYLERRGRRRQLGRTLQNRRPHRSSYLWDIRVKYTGQRELILQIPADMKASGRFKNCGWFTLAGAQEANWSQELQWEGKVIRKEFEYCASIVAFICLACGETFQVEGWNDQILCFKMTPLVSMFCRERDSSGGKKWSQEEGQRVGSKEGKVENRPAFQNNPSLFLLNSPAAFPRLSWGLLSTRQNLPIARVCPVQRCAPVVGVFTVGWGSWQLPYLFTILLSWNKNQCQSEQVLLMVLETRRIRKQQRQGWNHNILIGNLLWRD